jgi:hypothetical protein
MQKGAHTDYVFCFVPDSPSFTIVVELLFSYSHYMLEFFESITKQIFCDFFNSIQILYSSLLFSLKVCLTPFCDLLFLGGYVLIKMTCS